MADSQAVAGRFGIKYADSNGAAGGRNGAAILALSAQTAERA
ncbi:MAG: hypothetical protein ACXWWE_07060 [Nitrospira sp.]